MNANAKRHARMMDDVRKKMEALHAAAVAAGLVPVVPDDGNGLIASGSDGYAFKTDGFRVSMHSVGGTYATTIQIYVGMYVRTPNPTGGRARASTSFYGRFTTYAFNRLPETKKVGYYDMMRAIHNYDSTRAKG